MKQLWYFASENESKLVVTIDNEINTNTYFRTGTLNGSPCGMNQGNTTLDLSAKDKLNVTWHLGYPHKGENRYQIAYRDKFYY